MGQTSFHGSCALYGSRCWEYLWRHAAVACLAVSGCGPPDDAHACPEQGLEQCARKAQEPKTLLEKYWRVDAQGKSAWWLAQSLSLEKQINSGGFRRPKSGRWWPVKWGAGRDEMREPVASLWRCFGWCPQAGVDVLSVYFGIPPKTW